MISTGYSRKCYLSLGTILPCHVISSYQYNYLPITIVTTGVTAAAANTIGLLLGPYLAILVRTPPLRSGTGSPFRLGSGSG